MSEAGSTSRSLDNAAFKTGRYEILFLSATIPSVAV